MRAVPVRLKTWLDRVDPGAHGRLKGLRLVAAYALAETLGSLTHLPGAIGMLAGSFALWASVSEAGATRRSAVRDLIVLCIAAALGASSFAVPAPWLAHHGPAWPEATLVTGAFLASYLKRYGATGAGIGSQIYIGQLLACNAHLTPAGLCAIGIALPIAMISAIAPCLLGKAGQPTPLPPSSVTPLRWGLNVEVVTGLQAAISSLVIVCLDVAFGLIEAVWAITACVYVTVGPSEKTLHRARDRIVGTLIGVPLGLLCLPLATDARLLLWCAASLAMIVYAIALPVRYDIACGAFAFVLMVTMAVSGEHTVSVLVARAWETLLGCAVALMAAFFLSPLRSMSTHGAKVPPSHSPLAR